MAEQDFATFSAPGEKPRLDTIFQVSDKFLGELRLWLEQNPPAVQISSILGFSQFTANYATQGNADTTSSTTFGDCTNGGHQVGPTIIGLPAGRYVVLFGALSAVSVVGNIAAMSVAVNGTAVGGAGPPPTGGSAEARGTALYNVSYGITATLTAANNTLKAVYAVDNGAVTGSFGGRWLVALKYANP